MPCVDPFSRRPTFADPTYDDVIPISAGNQTVPSVAGLTFQQMTSPNECDYRILQAGSPGGLLAGLADGSVRQISHSISVQTFWAAVTPASGEVLLDW